MRRAHRRGAEMKVQAQPVKEKGPIEKIKDLENHVQVLMNIVTQLAQRMEQMHENQQALIQIAGSDQVEQTKDLIIVEQARASVSNAVAAGQLVAAETVGEKTLVVGHQEDANGVRVRPGMVQVPYAEFVPEVKEALLGKAVGHVYEDGKGNRFVVDELYDPVEKTEPNLTAEGEGELAAPASESVESAS